MKDIKLIAIDLDGTLLNSKKEIPLGFFDFVKKHQEYIICLSSGRQYYTLFNDFKEIGDDLVYVADNGSFIFEGKTSVHKETMTTDEVREILKMAEGDDNIVPILCGLNSAYISSSLKDTSFADPYYKRLAKVEDLCIAAQKDEIGKVTLYIKDLKSEEALKKLPVMPEGTEALVSGKDWIDISLKGITKGDGIRFLQRKYGLTEDNCLCFGDYMNDYSMFKVCKYRIAMANACKELKEIASFITKTNDENGVMEVLENIGKM